MIDTMRQAERSVYYFIHHYDDRHTSMKAVQGFHSPELAEAQGSWAEHSPEKQMEIEPFWSRLTGTKPTCSPWRPQSSTKRVS